MVAVEVPELGLRAPGCRPEISWASGMDLNQQMIWIEARQIGLQIAHREQLTGTTYQAQCEVGDLHDDRLRSLATTYPDTR